jgi:uncharacterized protein
MASFKKIKFYLLLLSGLAISIIAIYIFFSSSVVGSLLDLGKVAYAPDVYKRFLTNFSQTKTLTFNTASGTAYPIQAAVADTESAREKGLMGVTQLGDNEGMLFVFTDAPQLRSFWMKDTKIPLDIVFLDSNKQIVFIVHNAPICTADPCPIYSSESPAQYAIETNAGWTTKHGVALGDQVSF